MENQPKVKPECLKCKSYMGDQGETNYFCYVRGHCPGYKEKICDHDIQIHHFFLSGIVALMCTKCGYQPKDEVKSVCLGCRAYTKVSTDPQYRCGGPACPIHKENQ